MRSLQPDTRTVASTATLPSAAPRAAWAGGRVRAATRTLSTLYLELVGLLVLTAVLDLWRLSQNGWANIFYSAAVRSMSSSAHNFIYASFDPNGVMTVDKSPLALWVQAASVKLFGFHPLSVLVPQALIGVATVGLVYDLTRRCFGRPAGFVAGLALATTPITVAISRHNNPDAMLILCCTAALWCTVLAFERGRTRWLVLAAVCVGLGFETKMLIAFVVVPGIVAAWLWVAPRGRPAAVVQLLQAGAAGLVVAAAWPLLMALTPAADRPWISGTSNNSIWSLITGYNGLGRIGGQAGGPSSVRLPQGGGGLFGGHPGVFRLFDTSLGGQAGWLLGVAIVGAVAIAMASRLRSRDPRSGWLVAVGGAFVITAIAFSTAKGIFHPYYVSLLAPFTAALVGGGAAQIVRSGAAARVLAPLAVIAGAVGEVAIIHNNPEKIGWLAPVVMIGALALAVVLVAAKDARVHAAVIAVALAGLLVAPSTWAVETLDHPTSSTFPAGGPRGADAIGGVPTRAVGRRTPAIPALMLRARERGHRHRHIHISARVRRTLDASQFAEAMRYVSRHGGGAIGVRSQEEAAPPIIASGARVVGLGGFSGAESEPTVSWFATVVHAREVRWVLFNGSTHVHRGHRIGATRLLQGVAASCRLVPPRAYSHGGLMAHGRLYDCAGRTRALELYASGVKSRARLTKLSH